MWAEYALDFHLRVFHLTQGERIGFICVEF